MNSLADAAVQAAAAAAAESRPESSTSSSLLDRRPSSSISHPNYHRPASSYGSREADAPQTTPSPSSFSNPSPSADIMIKTGSDSTPVRRALLDTEKPEKRGSNLACLKCRAIKVKCSRANAEDERCKRCNRLDLVCEFKEHHRGRKPKKRARSDADSMGADEEDQLMEEEDDDAGRASFSGQATVSPLAIKARKLSRSPPPPTPPVSNQSLYKKTEMGGRYEASESAPKLPSPKGSVHGRWFGPYLQPIPSLEDSLFPRKPPSHGAAPHLQSHGSGQSQQHQMQHHHHHSYHHDRSRDLPPLSAPSNTSATRNGISANDHNSTWDRTSAWAASTPTSNPPPPRSHAGSITSAPTTMANDLRDDAIRQHVLNLDQAHELFDYFFAELNPPLALLDASLHTMEYCRQQSPILFSTILSVASRFVMPSLHRQCRRVAKSVLNLAAAEEICTIDHIQALILVITWKDPEDRTILRKAVRAIGYAYELGLHASFEGSTSTDVANASGTDGSRARSDSYARRYRRRLERDRQRTWIVLCLIHVLVRKDERHAKPRARIIPLEDYPDPNVWMQQAGDVLLSVDSRLAWSLDMSILTLENEGFLDMINRSEDATSFGGFFDRYRSRLDSMRKRYFDVKENGAFHPRFPMDKSAVAEIPYIDAHRDFIICQSTWHWAAKVASQRRTRLGNLAEQDASRSAFWFSQTLESALRCLRLFVHDLCKPGYVRVGHDYLVITASEVTKWFYLYREHLEASTVITGVEYLRATLRECSQPQRLASGDVVDTVREAPGYLVRFITAILDAGLNESYEKAKTRLAASTERFRAKAYHWGAGAESYGNSAGRDGAPSGGAAEERRETAEATGTGARRPPWVGGHSMSYHGSGAQERASTSDRTSSANVSGNSPPYRDVASAAARYSQAPSLPRGRSELGLNRMTSAHSPSASAANTSYERGGAGGVADKSQTSPTMFNLSDASSMAAPGFNLSNNSNSVAPHPAYLASSAQSQSSGGTGLGQAMPQSSSMSFSPAMQTGAGWSNTASALTPSWSTGTGLQAQPQPNNTSNSSGMPGLPDMSSSTTATAMTASVPSQGKNAGSGTNVVPLAADIGKNSIEGLAACLNTRDLNYWQDILGFDLATPAV